VLIPDNSLTPTKISTFGGGALDLVVGYDEPGCPLAYHLRYEERRPRLESEPLLRGRAIHGAIELIEQEAVSLDEALSRSWPAQLGPTGYDEALKHLLEFLSRPDDGTHTIASEIELKVPLFEHDGQTVYAGGIVDRVALDLSLPNLLYVDDYKTSARPLPRSVMETWFQGRHYAFLVRENADLFLPDHGRIPQIEARIVLTKHGYSLPKRFTDYQLDVYREWLISLATQILGCDDPTPVLNPGCSYCDFQMECPAWLSLPGSGKALYERVANANTEELIPLRVEAQKVESACKKIKEQIDVMARDRLEVDKVDELSVDNVTVGIDEAWRDEVVDLRAAHDLMGDEFYDLASLTKGAVEKWAKEHTSESSLASTLLVPQYQGRRLKWTTG